MTSIVGFIVRIEALKSNLKGPCKPRYGPTPQPSRYPGQVPRGYAHDEHGSSPKQVGLLGYPLSLVLPREPNTP